VAVRSPFTIGSAGLEVAVRVTPKAARDEVDGAVAVPGERIALAVRVRAAPDRGRANQAALNVLAEAWGVPKSRLSLIRGATSRVKTVLIAGGDHALAATLARRWEPK
jgi:uncharacterized protein YggU (UPF0235/DUF167 family)